MKEWKIIVISRCVSDVDVDMAAMTCWIQELVSFKDAINDWANCQLKDYENGAMMSISESVHGEIFFERLIDKLKEL